jgi:hypothetical protein
MGKHYFRGQLACKFYAAATLLQSASRVHLASRAIKHTIVHAAARCSAIDTPH